MTDKEERTVIAEFLGALTLKQWRRQGRRTEARRNAIAGSIARFCFGPDAEQTIDQRRMAEAVRVFALRHTRIDELEY
jgi:hypothetical protein